MESLINLLTRTRPVRRSLLTEKEKVSQMLCFSRHVYGNVPLVPAPLPFFEAVTSKDISSSLEISSPKETQLASDKPLPDGWRVVDEAAREELGLGTLQLEDDHSGFSSQLYQQSNTGHYVYALQGTNLTEINDWLNNILQGGGFEADQYKLALENGKLLVAQLGQENLEFTGHSLGGGLAATVATVTGVKAITFNAAGVHANTLKKYNKTVEDARQWVINYYIPGEILTFLQVKTLMPDAIGVQKELPAPLLEPNQVGKPPAEPNLIAAVKKLKTFLADYTEEEKRIFAERYRRHLIPALEEAVESL
jgi:hypothetical protein